MKAYTFKELRVWELEHGESFLDYHGDFCCVLEDVVVLLEATYPGYDFREDMNQGIMGLYNEDLEEDLEDDGDWNKPWPSMFHVELAWLECLNKNPEMLKRLEDELKEESENE